MSAVPLDRQPTLVGDLLELRPLAAADFPALFAVASDPLIWEQHPEPERCQEPTFRRFFDAGLASGGALVAIDRATGQMVGSSRFDHYDSRAGVVEIGWSFLARAYWGGRYNGEMKHLMLTHAFASVACVQFVIGPHNSRSQRAVQKLGAVRVGTLTDANGQLRVVFELTPARYVRGRGPETARG